MDIKLRAKLSAYARVETFEPTDSDHTCNLMTPISTEQIDKYLFSTSEPETPSDSEVDSSFVDFIDSLFQEDS